MSSAKPDSLLTDFGNRAEANTGNAGLGSKQRELFDRFLRMRENPLEFLKAVRTLDEVDKQSPIKHFPVGLEYLRWYVRLWQKERLIAVPKSRRMKMSWTNIALYLHDTMFFKGRNYAFVSKKEDDSDALVKRAEFILKHLDPEIFPKELVPAFESKYCLLSFPQIQSKIQGFPSGADQLRQYTFSGILGDECAFWPDAQEMYSGSYPTLEGGGRMTLISSPAPGFFKRLIYDQLDSTGEFDPEQAVGALRRSPSTGVTIWRNPKNLFCVFELHYTADPVKRSDEWKRTVKAAMPLRDFQQEYELQWDSFEGLPVYGDWNRTVHAKKGLQPQIGLPLLRGWDFGLTPACVVGQLNGQTLTIFHEFVQTNMGADRFSDLVLRQCALLYPAWGAGRTSNWFDFIDPAGQFRDQSAEGSCALVLDSKGLECIPGQIVFEERRRAVERFLTSISREGPGFQIDVLGCPVLTRGFEGGYRYSDSALVKEPALLRPLKDEHSHPHDALQYLASGILHARRRDSGTRQIPKIAYSFSQNAKGQIAL